MRRLLSRPVFLNLWNIRFPLSAIVSILHRVSGFFLALGVPFIGWLFYKSLASSASFNWLKDLILSDPIIRIWVWVSGCALIYHAIAGIRHLLMDLHLFENQKAGKVTSIIVFSTFLLITGLYSFWFFGGNL
jgi:succinate dehydrogenase / fumarate reductase, cytochrome b subunit